MEIICLYNEKKECVCITPHVLGNMVVTLSRIDSRWRYIPVNESFTPELENRVGLVNQFID